MCLIWSQTVSAESLHSSVPGPAVYCHRGWYEHERLRIAMARAGAKHTTLPHFPWTLTRVHSALLTCFTSDARGTEAHLTSSHLTEVDAHASRSLRGVTGQAGIGTACNNGTVCNTVLGSRYYRFAQGAMRGQGIALQPDIYVSSSPGNDMVCITFNFTNLPSPPAFCIRCEEALIPSSRYASRSQEG